MRIDEIAAKYENPYHPSDDIGLLSRDDFLYLRNSQGKSHPNEVYQTNIKNLNRPGHARRRVDLSHMDRDKKNIYVEVRDDVYVFFVDHNPAAIVQNDTLYYTIDFNPRLVPLRYPDKDLHIVPTTKKRIKYIEPLIKKLYNVGEKNIAYYPEIMKRLIVDDEPLLIRTKTMPYKKNSGAMIVLMKEDGTILGYASDEWGATLLRIADEYRGKNLGKILGGLWYELNPSYPSGGFSPSGRANSIRIWEDRVRTFLKNGWYSDFIRNGKITRKKVNEILSGLPERKSRPTLSKRGPTKAQPLMYVDDFQIVLYDKMYFEDQDLKYIYAHSFLQDSNGKTFIYNLDYEPAYKNIATYAIFQLAYNHGEKLYVAGLPSDHVELDGIEGIVTDKDGYASLTQPVVDLNKYAMAEKQYRKQHDKTYQIYYSMIEDAHRKWR